MKSVYAAAVLALMAGFGLDAAAQEGTIAAKVRRWMAEINGDIRVDDSGIDGTSIDVDSTLGLDEEEDFDELHATLGLPIIGRFNFQYLRGGYEGTNTLSNNITFAGTTFTASTQVDAKVDFESYTLLWQFGAPVPGDIGAGAIAGLKYLVIDAEVSDSFGNSEEAHVDAPIPVIGAYLRTNLMKFLSLEVQVHGIKYFDTFGTGVEGTFYDATVALDLKFSGVFVGVGYRWYHFDLSYENGNDAEVELDLEGMFFEAGFSF